MMAKKASTLPEAKRLAEKFQEEMVALMLERYDIDERRIR
jgi:hypothetical protein